MRLRNDTHLVSQLASGHLGLVRFDQLQAAGLPQSVVRNLIENGLLHAKYPEVYAVGHEALTQGGEYLAAAWALGPRGVLSDHSAAAHLELAKPGGIIHVTVPTYNGHPHRSNIRVHRRRLREYEVMEHEGVPCTSVCRTVMDIAATAPRILPIVFEEAQVRYRLRPAEVAAELVTRPGHRGTGRLRVLLDDAVDPGQVESILELLFLKLCEAFGLPRPLTQVWFGKWRVDFWFPEQRVVVETDGARWHASAAKRRRDKRKDADVEAAGQKVVHTPWADVVDHPARVASALWAAFAR